VNKLIEIAALILGGVSLFTVCFTSFAAMSGKPLNEVAVIGKFFEGAPPAGHEAQAPVEVEPPAPEAPRSDHEVIEANLGMLSVFTLPSPYSPSELQELTEELKGRLFRLDQEERDLEAREQQVEEKLRGVDERLAQLTALRTSLEEFEASLIERARETERAEAAVSQRRQQRWAEVARLLDELEDADASAFLSEYEPDEAAQVLRQLDPERAAVLLAGLRTQPGVEDWRAYVDAFSETAPDAP
jgi:flagellar motility protein MotE (MotC chaperone)